jgi:hypothetical protein
MSAHDRLMLPPFAYRPLLMSDLDLLMRWGLAPDSAKGKGVVIVGRLQRWLVTRGHKLVVDGKLGPHTLRAASHVRLPEGAGPWAIYIDVITIRAGFAQRSDPLGKAARAVVSVPDEEAAALHEIVAQHFDVQPGAPS